MLGLNMVSAIIGPPFCASQCPERLPLVTIACAHFLAPRTSTFVWYSVFRAAPTGNLQNAYALLCCLSCPTRLLGVVRE
jgi:hypothetical protein